MRGATATRTESRKPNVDGPHTNRFPRYKFQNWITPSDDELTRAGRFVLDALAAGKPVVVGVPCDSSPAWYDGKSVIDGPTHAPGGHAVLIYAYKEGVFWFKNSWGDKWGSNGCGRFSYRFVDHCLISAG
jgi:C1A family cysteine protease